MTYAQEITKLRTMVGDTRRRVHVDWTGDGSSTIFQCPVNTFPILDQAGTYIVKVAGSQKTETTDYTLDKETGTLVLGSAPTNGQAVTIDHSAVYLTDSSWLSILNDVIKSLGDDFYKEVVDDSLTATVNMMSLSCPTNTIAVYDFKYRQNTAESFTNVNELTNWRYSRDENKIYIGDYDAFDVAYLLRLRILKTYTLGTVVGDALDIQDKYLTIIEYGAQAKYWQYRYKDVIELVSKASTENTRTPLQELIMLVDRFNREYEAEKAKLKPQKPPYFIPNPKPGSKRP